MSITFTYNTCATKTSFQYILFRHKYTKSRMMNVLKLQPLPLAKVTNRSKLGRNFKTDPRPVTRTSCGVTTLAQKSASPRFIRTLSW